MLEPRVACDALVDFDSVGGYRPANRTLVVPGLQQLLSIRGSYNGKPAAAPPTTAVANITLRHIGFRDSSVRSQAIKEIYDRTLLSEIGCL